MFSAYARRAVVALAIAAATTACTIHDANTPSLTGPSGLATTLVVVATPDSISQDGGSQSSIKVTAIGPDGKGIGALPLRVDMRVGGVAQDFGTLSARTVVTNNDGTATVIYTAPPAPSNGVFLPCQLLPPPNPPSPLPGSCVAIGVTATGTNSVAASSETVTIRLVPPGVILPPPDTPTVSFQFSPATIAPSQPVTFDATASQSVSGIVSYSWNFGDGTVGSGAVVSHAYANVASYTVTLTVTNSRGGTASTTRSVAVTASAAPIANFTPSPAAVFVGTVVAFNGASSAASPGRTIRNYDWDFGDNSPHGSGQATTHVYALANTYNVTLVVTDDLGQQGTKTLPLVVGSGNPTAVLILTKNGGLSITADAGGSTAVGSATITNYTYQWGDSPPSQSGPTAASIASKTYGAVGTYTVRLIVQDSLGRIGTTTQLITLP